MDGGERRIGRNFPHFQSEQKVNEMAKAGLKEFPYCDGCGGFFNGEKSVCPACDHLSASEKRSLHLLWEIRQHMVRQTELLESFLRMKLNDKA